MFACRHNFELVGWLFEKQLGEYDKAREQHPLPWRCGLHG